MAESEKPRFGKAEEILFYKIVGLCLANYVEIEVLKNYLAEQGIAIDEERLEDIRRDVRLGGAGLREHGYAEWASQLRFTQERIDELEANEEDD